MYTMHPTLLIGPADFDPARMPREEFAARTAQLWRGRPEAGGALVYGDSSDHAALAYLTHFTPKLEAALALIPRQGPPRLLVGGGVNMISAARPLTPIEEVGPLRSAGNCVADWARNLPLGGRVILINAGAMPPAMYEAITRALGAGQAREIVHCETSDIVPMGKSPRELALLRDACITLGAAARALAEAKRGGAGATAALLRAEHAAHRRGAQDVRSLISLDEGHTLRPFEHPVERPIDPLQVYLAVRHGGYWAEGFVMLCDRQHPPLDIACAGLRTALRRWSEGKIANMMGDVVAPRRLHPVIAAAVVAEAGLALEGRPGRDLGAAHDTVVSLRAGVVGDDGAAIVSAMLAIADGEPPEILWSAADLGGPA